MKIAKVTDIFEHALTKIFEKIDQCYLLWVNMQASMMLSVSKFEFNLI